MAKNNPTGEPAPSPKRRWVRGVVAGLGYVVIAALAWRAVDHQRLLDGLGRLRATHIMLVVAISLLHIAARAYRYHRLVLRNDPKGYRWTDGFAIFLIGLSTSAVTPARAGDFVKAQLVRRFDVPFSAGVGLVLIERMLDLLVLTGSILVAGLFVSGDSGPWARASLALLVLLMLGVAAISSGRVRQQGATFVTRVLSGISKTERTAALSAKLESIFVTWDAIFTSPARLLAYLGGSAIVWAIEFAKLWCVLALLDAPVPIEVAFFVYPVAILAGVLTLLPFSDGVVGLTGVALLSSIGHVAPATATVAVVLDRCASCLPPILLAATSPLWPRELRAASRDASLSSAGVAPLNSR